VSEPQLPSPRVAGAELELVDGELVTSVGPGELSPSPRPIPSALETRNRFREAERIAVRAATASTRRR
jgi:hypothetical protein